MIYKKNRGHITTIEARQILEPYGDLAKCELLKDHIQEAMDLPPAIFVEFAVFNPSRDLLSVSIFLKFGVCPLIRELTTCNRLLDRMRATALSRLTVPRKRASAPAATLTRHFSSSMRLIVVQSGLVDCLSTPTRTRSWTSFQRLAKL